MFMFSAVLIEPKLRHFELFSNWNDIKTRNDLLPLDVYEIQITTNQRRDFANISRVNLL